MNIKVACPHCQVVGVVPKDLKHANDWPVACHHCHQHYFVPVVASPAALSRQIELRCSDCGHEIIFDKAIYKSIIEGNFPLFCPDCHARLPEPQNGIIELVQTAADCSNATRAMGVQTGLAFVFLGFFIVSVSVMAAHEGLISQDWLDRFLLHIPDHTMVSSYLMELLKPS